jgi:hypothetical protein
MSTPIEDKHVIGYLVSGNTGHDLATMYIELLKKHNEYDDLVNEVKKYIEDAVKDYENIIGEQTDKHVIRYLEVCCTLSGNSAIVE